MSTHRLLTVSFAILFLAARTVNGETHAISLGGTTISLPSPEGFFRYDGKSSKIDSFEQRLLPASNRLLAAFGSEETLAEVLTDHFPKIERHFSAQSDRSLESVDITPAFFAEFKPELRTNISSQIEKHRRVIDEVERNASSATSTSLKFGEMIPLGVFDETSDSLCFSMLGKVQVPAISQSYVSIIACCVVRVSNRVFYLYASSPYRDKSDIEWARRSVQHWRDAVLKANRQ